MARLPELTDRSTLPDDALEAYDSIAASRGRVAGLFAVLMNSPEIAGRTAHFGTYVRFEKSLPQEVHELAMSLGAHIAEGALEWRGHSRAAREAGVAEPTMQAIEQDGPTDGLPPRDALLIKFGRDLMTKHRVDDADFEALRAELGERGIVDLVATFGYQALLGCILNGLDIQPAPAS